jgi:hypothetical protein
MKKYDLIRKLVEQFNVPKADRYDLVLRDYDKSVELIGFVADPTQDMRDFVGREMLFPKRWLTLDVFPQDMVIDN